MFSGLLAASSVVLHLLLTENTVNRRFRSNILSFIGQSWNDLAWRHTREPFFVDCIDYFLPFFWSQLIDWIGVIGICTTIFIGIIFLIKRLPSVISTFGNPEVLTGLFQSGTIVYGFVNKLGGFLAICGAY